jgi:D-sedoheptulose 7-phosphate isomerase
MKESTRNIFNELFDRYSNLQCCRLEIEKAFVLLKDCLQNQGTVFACGNGGSAADCEHIVGELMKSFKKKRPIPEAELQKLVQTEEGEILSLVLDGGLKAVSLTSHLALSTAFANDKEPLAIFAQQLYVLGKQGDTLLTLSTSGNSKNCVYTAIVAKAKGIKIIALTGESDSRLSELADVCIKVPEKETYKVQELHLSVYHCLCAMLEEEIF